MSEASAPAVAGLQDEAGLDLRAVSIPAGQGLFVLLLPRTEGEGQGRPNPTSLRPTQVLTVFRRAETRSLGPKEYAFNKDLPWASPSQLGPSMTMQS